MTTNAFTRVLRRLLPLFFWAGYQVTSPASAAELELPGYQRNDGTITVHFNGAVIDPYFAAKALLAAKDAGLDIRRAGVAWIEWALQHQRPDGRFDRFCAKGKGYDACATADADDAMLAVWIELLTKLTPSAGMPSTWKNSLRRADRYLARLYDKNTGIYLISKTMRVGLLMDNVEVYSSKKVMSQFYSDSGDTARAKIDAGEAEKLHKNIVRVFWQPDLESFRVSTQRHTKPGFYPDQVAQLFPILADMPTPRDNTAIYTSWMKANRETWLQRTDIDYPWGLIALTADKMGDRDTAACWLAHARPLRYGQRWNVLEEALYQAFDARTLSDDDVRPACHRHAPG